MKVFVLSMFTKSYKGNAAEEVVVTSFLCSYCCSDLILFQAAMRELQVPDLPGDKDIVQLDIVHTLIKDKLADARNAL